MTDLAKVVVTDFITDQLTDEKRILDGIATVEALGAEHEDDLAGRIEDADAMMMYHAIEVTEKTIARLEKCRLIVRCGVGFDNVDHLFARSRGIDVATVPDYGTEDVADSAIGMMLSLTRGIHFLNSRLRAGRGEWSYTQVEPLRRLRGRVLGIIGIGRIGTAVAQRAKALGMDVAFYDPFKPDGYEKALGVRRVEELEQLLDQAFVVTPHCPLTDETRHMIDAAAIARMPRGSYLVNTSRGGVVDTSAIPAAIESGQLGGAAIDVLEVEPPPEDYPLIAAWRDPNHPAHDRVIVNPHSAFYCVEGLTDMRVKSTEACRRALTGKPVRNVVN